MTNPEVDALIAKFHQREWRRLIERSLQQAREHARQWRLALEGEHERQWRLALEAAEARASDAGRSGFLRGFLRGFLSGIAVASALWAVAILLVHL